MRRKKKTIQIEKPLPSATRLFRFTRDDEILIALAKLGSIKYMHRYCKEEDLSK